jgi:hypothetical protein
MSIDQLVAVVPVSDMNTAMPWYELLVGRPPDNHPMETLVEWRITDTGWIQVFHDPERQVAEVTGRGLSLGDIQPANKGVRLCTVIDPDGNRITFIGGFRDVY